MWLSDRQWENACLASTSTGSIQNTVSREDSGRIERLNCTRIQVYCLDNVKGKQRRTNANPKGELKDQEVAYWLLLENRHHSLYRRLWLIHNLFTCQRHGKCFAVSTCVLERTRQHLPSLSIFPKDMLMRDLLRNLKTMLKHTRKILFSVLWLWENFSWVCFEWVCV